jgi:hypothetical protein
VSVFSQTLTSFETEKLGLRCEIPLRDHWNLFGEFEKGRAEIPTVFGGYSPKFRTVDFTTLRASRSLGANRLLFSVLRLSALCGTRGA